jgi:hypothetical protein
LVAALGVNGAKTLLRLATYALLILAAGIALVALARPSRFTTHPPTLYLAGLLCALALLGLYRLEFYAQTLAHGCAELVIAAFVLGSMLPAAESKPSGIPTAAIVLGVLIGGFELLTGPSLVAAGIAVLLGHCAAPQAARPYGRAALVGLGCTAGILMALFWQQLLIGAFSDARPFYQFATHLAMRLQLHQFFAIPFEAEWAIPANMHLYSPGDVIDAIGISLPSLAYGSKAAAQIVFAGSAAAIAAGLVFARRRARPGCVIAAAVGLAVPAWYFAFSNHTVLHSLYMIRMAVLLPLSAGISLMFLFAPEAWMQPRGTPVRAT